MLQPRKQSLPIKTEMSWITKNTRKTVPIITIKNYRVNKTFNAFDSVTQQIIKQNNRPVKKII